MKTKIECPMCGGTSVTLATEQRHINAEDGTELSFRAQYSECASCGEAFYTRRQAKAASRAAVGALRTHNGRLTPAEIKAIRKQFGVTQEKMQRVMKVGKKSFPRWENGTVQQSRAADQLLREFRESPDLFYRMASEAGVNVPRPEIEVLWDEMLTNANKTVFTAVTFTGNVSMQWDKIFAYSGEFVPGRVGWVVREPLAPDYLNTGADQHQSSGSVCPGLLLQTLIA
jgi:putative zinc finger/helix-turn-helix YgiT family protein